MKTTNINRREFFKNLPGRIFKEIQTSINPSSPQTALLNLNQCIAWGGMNCQLCYLACHLREKAIVMNDQKPIITASECDGCTSCVDACRTVNDPPAIVMKDKV